MSRKRTPMMFAEWGPDGKFYCNMRKREVNNPVLYASYGKTPAMFAEWGPDGRFYSTHFLLWLTRTIFLFKYVGEDLCHKDLCYIGWGTDEAHWRCGTNQCG